MRQRSAGNRDEATAVMARAGFRQLTPLQRVAIPHILSGRDLVAEAPPQSGKTVAMLVPPLLTIRSAAAGTVAIILVGDAEELRKIQRQLRSLTRAAGSTLVPAVVGIDEGIRREVRLLEQKPGLLVSTPQRLIDHIRQNNVALDKVSYVAVDRPPNLPDFGRDVEFILSKCPPGCQIVTFVRSVDEAQSAGVRGGKQRPILRTKDWQSETGAEPEAPLEGGSGERGQTRGGRRTDVSSELMKDEAGGSSVSEDSLKAAARSVLEKISHEGGTELRKLRKAYRAAVPIGQRASLAAYLLRELAGGERVPAAPAAAPKGAAAGKVARLFINVGRNRRVFPNDILDLLTSQLGIKRSEIGEVRVLDNYSFVEIQSRHAGRAVAELTGVELKGRKLAVDYARPRDGKKRA